MIRYTTPTYTLGVNGIDLTDKKVYVTFAQGSRIVTIEDPECSYENGKTRITCTMTQQDSAKFKVGEMDVQVNWLDNGRRNATVVKQIPVLLQLLQEVK